MRATRATEPRGLGAIDDVELGRGGGLRSLDATKAATQTTRRHFAAARPWARGNLRETAILVMVCHHDHRCRSSSPADRKGVACFACVCVEARQPPASAECQEAMAGNEPEMASRTFRNALVVNSPRDHGSRTTRG